MKTFREVKKSLLKDKVVKREYERLGAEFTFVRFIIEKRLEHGFTQADLAHKIGTKQSAISRLESGTYNPTIGFLEKIAKALDGHLAISIS